MSKVIIDERFDASLKLMMSGNAELAEQIYNVIKDMPNELKTSIRKMLSENSNLDKIDEASDELFIKFGEGKTAWEAELSGCGLNIKKYGPNDDEECFEITLFEKSDILEEIVSIEDKEDYAEIGSCLKVVSFEDGSGHGIIGDIEYIVSKKGNNYFVSIEEDFEKEQRKYVGVTKSVKGKHKIDLSQFFSPEELKKAKEEELEF